MKLAEVKNTGDYERETPPWLYEYLTEKYFDCNIDCAASEYNKKCKVFYSEDNSFLNPGYDYIEERDHVMNLWLNPPYARDLVKPFIKKFMKLCLGDGYKGILLVPTTICSASYFKYIGYTEKDRRDSKVEIEFIEKRVKFIDDHKKFMNSAPFASMAVIVNDPMYGKRENMRIIR